MSNYFDKTLHDLFPIDERYGGYVAYRSHRDLHTDVPEYSFVIGPENTSAAYMLDRCRENSRARFCLWAPMSHTATNTSSTSEKAR